MSPLLKALSGSAVRWLMVVAGMYGVDLPAENAETLVNAALVAVPLLWSAYQKWRTHDRIQTAEMQVKLANQP